jgi:hypothetical protein
MVETGQRELPDQQSKQPALRQAGNGPGSAGAKPMRGVPLYFPWLTARKYIVVFTEQVWRKVYV